MKVMTRNEFIQKYGEMSMFDTQDVLMRIASNLSDMHYNRADMDDKLNVLKNYIFDYKNVLRSEERMKREAEQEMKEFQEHLGRF